MKTRCFFTKKVKREENIFKLTAPQTYQLLLISEHIHDISNTNVYIVSFPKKLILSDGGWCL